MGLIKSFILIASTYKYTFLRKDSLQKDILQLFSDYAIIYINKSFISFFVYFILLEFV